MNNIETMKLALEALETMQNAIYNIGGEHVTDLGDAVEKADISEQAITSLRQAIEQAQQAEPDYYGLTKDHLWMSITKDHYDRLKPEFRMACYTSPPPRQPLTDEEIKQAGVAVPFDGKPDWSLRFARAIEAAHGIKENT